MKRHVRYLTVPTWFIFSFSSFSIKASHGLCGGKQAVFRCSSFPYFSLIQFSSSNTLLCSWTLNDVAPWGISFACCSVSSKQAHKLSSLPPNLHLTDSWAEFNIKMNVPSHLRDHSRVSRARELKSWKVLVQLLRPDAACYNWRLFLKVHSCPEGRYAWMSSACVFVWAYLCMCARLSCNCASTWVYTVAVCLWATDWLAESD